VKNLTQYGVCDPWTANKYEGQKAKGAIKSEATTKGMPNRRSRVVKKPPPPLRSRLEIVKSPETKNSKDIINVSKYKTNRSRKGQRLASTTGAEESKYRVGLKVLNEA
jgi:hypothetical protein